MTAPTLLWLRRDLRLADHPAWSAAVAAGGPVIPVFILDPIFESYGAAPKWRLGAALRSLDARLRERGSRLILRRGAASDALDRLIAETGAARVIWSRQYEAAAIARDTEIKRALVARGIEAASVNGSLLFEPWTVETKTGGFYRVYTPFWKAVKDTDVPPPLPAPADLCAPEHWPSSETLEGLALGDAMNRGAPVVAEHARIGEAAAQDRLHGFLERVDGYASGRDRLDLAATSGLSENLTYGEISPRHAWHAVAPPRGDGAETFLKELVWREFAYHLLFHTPEIAERNWRAEWDAFPWGGDDETVDRWRQGRTGIEIVDAAMRELYVTGTMHNRARMLVGSYLTKHMLKHWRLGEAWFRECLIDWDPASNAMGWQWVAGSGPDATPFFRIFNPETQAEKFDPRRAYRDRWLAEGKRRPHPDALRFFDAVPKSWGLSPDDPYPAPLVDLKAGRERALAAYRGRDAAA